MYFDYVYVLCPTYCVYMAWPRSTHMYAVTDVRLSGGFGWRWVPCLPHLTANMHC